MNSRSVRFSLRQLVSGSSFSRMLPVFLVPVVALVLAAAPAEAWAKHKKKKKEIPFSIAKMIIEFNSSANEGLGDVGVQVLLDGEPWRSLRIESPNGRTILDITASRSLRKQGLTELFFESSEPSLDEVPLEDFLVRFPAGKYEFEGRTIEGIEIEGEAILTHVIPAGPEIVSPKEGDLVDPKNLVIEWKTVTTTIDGSPDLTIVAYQVIVERTDNADHGAAPRTFDIKLPAKPGDTQSVQVPPEFLEADAEYAVEVLAIEQGGNQTITEGEPFTTTTQ